MPKKGTPAQTFAAIFARFTSGATKQERETGERTMDAWLKRNGKTRADIPSILAQALADERAANPPPPPSDPRDAQVHPFEDPTFTPVGLVEGLIKKYAWMSKHVRIIYALSIIFTHVYLRFAIAPRVALVSEDPDSGKTTGLEVGRHLAFRPNPESFATGAAVGEFLGEGPGSVFLDEVDQGDKESQRRLGLVWNLGHKRGAKRSMVIGGKRKLVSLHAPMFAAGISGFLATTQRTRTFVLEMQQYTEETKPEREYTTEDDFTGFDAVYSFIRHWVAKVKLDPKPSMPPGAIRRNADNMRGLLSIADACGSNW